MNHMAYLLSAYPFKSKTTTEVEEYLTLIPYKQTLIGVNEYASISSQFIDTMSDSTRTKTRKMNLVT